jgi:hypothetical protein
MTFRQSENRNPQSASLRTGAHHAGPWARLTRKIREAGVRYTATLVLRTVLPPSLFGFRRMIILELLPKPLARATAPDTFWGTPKDAHHLCALGHPIEVIEHRLSEGARVCALGGHEGVLAYAWFRRQHHDDDALGIRFRLNSEELWLYDAMVRADQRGLGLYPRLLRSAGSDLAEEGVRRVLIAVERANRNSIRAHEAAGARSVSSIWSLRFLGFTLARDNHGFQVAWTGRRGLIDLTTSRLA